jgi:Secretion system C-terminal sorting domain
LNQNLPDNETDVAVVLYNKYRGILRILLQACRGKDYNAAKIVLKFDNNTKFKTDLLEYSRGSISALDKQFKEILGSAGYAYTNSNSKWFYADFPVMYDPCTPLYSSKLRIESYLISKATIDLVGAINGEAYAKDLNGNAQIQQPGSFSWTDNVLPAAVKFVEAFPDSNKLLLQVLKYMQKQQNSYSVSDIFQMVSNLGKADFLKEGIDKVPWLRGGLSVLDFFVSGGLTKSASSSGPQPVVIMPMTLSFTANLKGTIDFSDQYHKVIFTNPGSKDAKLDPDGYPYYNEVLGIFNFLQTPEVFYERREENLRDGYNYPFLPCYAPYSGACETSLRVNVDRFKIDTSSLKYVLNPAAGVTIQNMSFQLIVNGQYYPSYYAYNNNYNERHMSPDFNYEGEDPAEGKGGLRFGSELLLAKTFAKRTFKAISNVSAYVPNTDAQAYGQTPFNTFWSPWRPIGITKQAPESPVAYLKVVLNLRRNNTVPGTQNILYTATFPVLLKQGGYMQYWQNDLAYLDPNFVQNPTPHQPADSVFVSKFCKAAPYYSIERQSTKATTDSQDSIPSISNKLITAISPNPNDGNFMITLHKEKAILNNLIVYDVSGRIVFQENNLNISLQDGLAKKASIQLDNGMYILKVITNVGSSQKKFIVSQ